MENAIIRKIGVTLNFGPNRRTWERHIGLRIRPIALINTHSELFEKVVNLRLLW